MLCCDQASRLKEKTIGVWDECSITYGRFRLQFKHFSEQFEIKKEQELVLI